MPSGLTTFSFVASRLSASKNIYIWHLNQIVTKHRRQLQLNKCASRRHLKCAKLATKCRETGNMFRCRGPATVNNLLPSHRLVSCMTHMDLPDDCIRQPTLDTGCHSSGKYDRAVPCTDLNCEIWPAPYAGRCHTS